MNKVLGAATILAWAIAQMGPAAAQAYPTRTITIVVNNGAGGPADIIARTMKDHLAAKLGQTVVVENRPASGGVVATAAIKRAEPDGYTILFSPGGPMVTAPIINPNSGYDPVKDFVHVSVLADVTVVYAINAQIPAKSLKEFQALAKAAPGKYSYASNGLGASSHLYGAYFAQLAGVDMLHIPYSGPPQAAMATVSGEVSMYTSTPALVMQQAEIGKLRLLAQTSSTRAKQLPNVPTVAEAGFPDLEGSVWFGLLVPQGTPAAIVSKINDAAQFAIRQPDVQKVLDTAVFGTVGKDGAEFAKMHTAEYAKWEKIIKGLGIKIN